MPGQIRLDPRYTPPVKGLTGLMSPVDHGALAWTGDPILAGSNLTIGAGSVFLYRVKMADAGKITKVGMALRTTAPAGLTNTFLGIYTQSGPTATKVAATADISATMNGVSAATYFNLSAATPTYQAGQPLLVAFLFGSATTAPTVLTPAGNPNRFIAAKQNNRSIAWSSGLTALPATMDLSSASASDGGVVPSMFLA